jgi:RNA polymerase sigma-70 factor (ECF subfamily)
LTQIGVHQVGAGAEDLEIVARLRAGDERTFEALVERYYGLMLSVALKIAKTRGVREARSIPFATLTPEGEEAAIEPGRFQSDSEPFPGHWRAYPRDWQRLPQDAMFTRETLQVAIRAIDALPDTQRTVITMRDVYGYGADEVCAALDISEGNQRVLLHRARSRVRAALERHLDA